MSASRHGNRVEIGSKSKEQSHDIDDAGFNDYKQLCYKFFKHPDYKVISSDGKFIRPFCAYDEDEDHDYTHLLQHANRVAEGSLSRKQIAKHFAMARYLAFVKAEPLATSPCDILDQSPNRLLDTSGRKRSKSDITKCTGCNGGPQTPARKQPRVSVAQKLAMAEKREKEALDKVGQLESKLDEVNDQLNALIAKDRESNDELQGVRRELNEGLSDIQPNRNGKGEIGIKRFGELDPEDLISELHERFPSAGDSDIKGVKLCTLWQEKIKDPHWYPYQITEDVIMAFRHFL